MVRQPWGGISGLGRGPSGAHPAAAHPGPSTRLHGVPRRRAVVVIPFEGAQQLEDKAVVVAQKRPAAVLGILLAQRVAEHG
jgi:hypothetical protein